MTPEKQRIALAEWDGWKQAGGFTKDQCDYGWWNENYDYGCVFNPLPNYLEDLNAVHELEKKLDGRLEYIYYTIALPKVCGGDRDGITNFQRHKLYIHATATQRCEAILRTIGKWEN